MAFAAVAAGLHEGDVFQENFVLIVREGESETFRYLCNLL